MSFLLDTNVVSEWAKPSPDPGVWAWVSEADEDRVFLSVVTIAELRRGIACMTESARRRRLDEWLRHDVTVRFEGRILPIDQAIADAWGEIAAEREARGHAISAMDGFIAATAAVHGLTLVTRNTRDFDLSEVRILNPWRTEC